MQLKNYSIGDCIVKGEVSTYRAVSMMSSQVVYVHVLPAEPSRLEYWMGRIRELQNNLSISPFLEVSGYQGRHCLISHEIPGFTGFAQWLAAAVPGPANVGSGNEADAFFQKPASATELLGRSAPQPKKKRDYQPPQPADPSEYSRLFLPPKLEQPQPQPQPEPKAAAPLLPLPNPGQLLPRSPEELLSQAVQTARLQEQLSHWRTLAYVGGGTAVTLFIVLLAVLFRRS